MIRPDRPTSFRPRPRSALRAVAAVAALVLASCGGSDDGNGSGASTEGGATAPSTSSQALPAACTKPPLSMRLEALGAAPTGGAEFKVTDAAARRVPIVLGEKDGGTDAAATARQIKKAKTSKVALYTLYLADYSIDRKELTGNGFGALKPPPGGTIGTLSIVPSRDIGLQVGDVVTFANKPGYETSTTLSPLGLTIESDQHPGPDAYTDITGQVTVLALSDDLICLDIDMEVLGVGGPALAAKGVVVAPVYRAGESFSFR